MQLACASKSKLWNMWDRSSEDEVGRPLNVDTEGRVSPAQWYHSQRRIIEPMPSGPLCGKVALCVWAVGSPAQTLVPHSWDIYSLLPESCCAGILGDWVSFRGLIVSHKSERNLPGPSLSPLTLAPAGRGRLLDSRGHCRVTLCGAS